jgi:hypothetical protein
VRDGILTSATVLQRATAGAKRPIRSVKPAEQRNSLVHSQLADIEEFEDYADARCIAKFCKQMREEQEGRRIGGVHATRVRRHRLGG